MSRRVVDVDLENFQLVPRACLSTVFWEMTEEDPDHDPAFEKEEWFSSTLLEWGRCGKLVVEEGKALAFAQYAPATLFPRLRDYAAADPASPAAYLAYCYAEDGHRGEGLGTELIHEIARDLVDRGYRAIEAIGDREWEGGWVLPMPFLVSSGFTVVRDDPRFPLLRLEVGRPVRPLESTAHALAYE